MKWNPVFRALAVLCAACGIAMAFLPFFKLSVVINVLDVNWQGSFSLLYLIDQNILPAAMTAFALIITLLAFVTALMCVASRANRYALIPSAAAVPAAILIWRALCANLSSEIAASVSAMAEYVVNLLQLPASAVKIALSGLSFLDIDLSSLVIFGAEKGITLYVISMSFCVFFCLLSLFGKSSSQRMNAHEK